MASIIPTAASRSRAVVAAVVLGTALSAGGSRSAAAELRDHAGRRDDNGGPSPDAVRDIGRYCQACWRNARLPVDQWADCTQQVYVRLLERLPGGAWPNALGVDGEDRREFLRAIDTVKKRAQRGKRFVELSNEVADVRPAAGFDREAVWQAAEGLTDRQRRIVELTAAGWATPDIARELATTPERVSDEKYKAVRKLRAELGVEG